MLKLFAGFVVAAALAVGGFFTGHPPQPAPLAGSYSPTGGGTYRLGQSVGISDTSFKLASFKEPISNIPYTMSYLSSDIEYGTIAPQSSVSEFVSFTGISQNSDGSATLTGVTRGLARTPGTGGCVASTTLAQSHSGQSIFILSNPPCQLAEYLPLRTTSTSTAIVVFGSTTVPRLDQPGAQSTGTYISTTSEFASVAYVNKVAVSGSPNATASVKGLVQLGTGAQFGSSTILGSTGASLVPDSSLSTSSPYTAGSWNVITQPNAKIKQLFLDLTEPFVWSGLHTFSVGFLAPASSTAQSLHITTADIKSGAESKVSITTSPTNVSNTTSSTTVVNVTIPANTLSTNNAVRITLFSSYKTGSQDYFEWAYGTATTTFNLFSGANDGFATGTVQILISASGATNTQKISYVWTVPLPKQINATRTLGTTNATTTSFGGSITGAVDSTQAQQFVFIAHPDASSMIFNTDQVVVEAIK